MKAKYLIVAISLVLCLSVGGIAVASEMGYINSKPDNTDVVFSLWGDSIAEAVLGASPIGERDGFGYYGLVGRIANFEFHNRSVSGHLTYQLDNYLRAPDKGARMNNTLLKTSDIIAISILGNDLLQNDLSQMVVDYSVGDTTNLDKNVAIAREDFYSAINYVREVNPDAKIMVQTLYNPMFVGSHILISSARDQLYANGLNDDEIRQIGGEMLDSLNSIVYDYAEDFPGAITIVEVRKAFDAIYDADNHRGAELFYNDGVHPSNEGHAVIAGLYLEQLVKWGYLTEDQMIKGYKDIRVDQLERLYTDAEGMANAKKEVKKGSTFDEITNSFFRYAEDKTAVLDKKATENNPFVAFESQKRYYIDNSTTALGMPIGLIVNKNSSYIEFRTDGTMKLQIMLPDGASGLVDSLLAGTDLSTVDISPIIDKYAVELFPGFTTDKVLYSFGLLDSNLGLSFVGLDTEHEGIKNLIDSIEKEGKLPATLSIPDGLGVKYEGRYTVREVVNPLTGEKWTSVHMGAPYENGDGFIIMTITENEDGKEMVYFDIDFLQMHVSAVAK